MRIDVAAFKACMGIVALCWVTTALAAPPGTSPAGTASGGTAPSGTPLPVRHSGDTLPSIRLLETQTNLVGTCGGSAFTVNTFINVTTQSSADVVVSAPGVGIIEEFTDATGKNIGPYNAAYSTFEILAFGGGLAPNTQVTITITTYAGPNLTGSPTFVSSLAFNCTTGQVLSTQPSPPLALPAPTLSLPGLAAMAVLLLAVGALVLRRPVRQRRVRR